MATAVEIGRAKWAIATGPSILKRKLSQADGDLAPIASNESDIFISQVASVLKTHAVPQVSIEKYLITFVSLSRLIR